MWLREILSESSGRLSAKRVTMMIATVALAASVVMLSVAALSGWDVAGALGAVALPLAGLGGFAYVGGRYAERPFQPPREMGQQEPRRPGRWEF